MGYTRKKSIKRTKRYKKYKAFIGGTINDAKCIFLNLGSGKGKKNDQIDSGLGNQLFMYAAGLVAKNKTGMQLCLLPSLKMLHSKIDYRYLFKKGTAVEHDNLQSRIDSATKVHSGIDIHNSWKNNNIPSNTSKDMILVGHLYQNYGNIVSVFPEIRKDLKEEFIKKYGEKSKYNIQSNTSAFMHVRRGDYLITNRNLKIDYYNEALKRLANNSNIKTIYVVSNDIDWCKQQNFKFRDSTESVIITDKSDDELLSMYVMMLCKAGGIISRSTYSMWGAILGPDENNESTIVSPINFGTGEMKELNVPGRWIQI